MKDPFIWRVYALPLGIYPNRGTLVRHLPNKRLSPVLHIYEFYVFGPLCDKFGVVSGLGLGASG